MQTLRNKLSRHTSIREISGAVIGMAIVLMLVTPIYAAFDHVYERYSPTEWWFQYDKITPFHKVFSRGDDIRFITSAEYKRDLEVQWFDTLWCDTGDKHVRLNTQITPDQPTFKEKSIVGRPNEAGIYPTWEYRASPVPDNAIACRLRSYIVVTTPLGYQKSQLFETEWFYVNK